MCVWLTEGVATGLSQKHHSEKTGLDQPRYFSPKGSHSTCPKVGQNKLPVFCTQAVVFI